MNIEDFKMDSVKILNDDVSIVYHTSTDDAKRTYDKKIKELKPHPDFYAKLKAFKLDYLAIFGFKEEDMESTIKGISANKKNQIQISGMISTMNNIPCNLNTPYVSKESEEMSSEEEVIDKNLEGLRTEAWKYIWERKSNQTEMDFDGEKKEEETPPEK